MKKATTIKLEAPFVYTVYIRNPEKTSRRPLSENMKAAMAQMADGGKYEPDTSSDMSALAGLFARGLVECAELEVRDRHGVPRRLTPEEIILRDIYKENPVPKGISHVYWVRTSNPTADRRATAQEKTHE